MSPGELGGADVGEGPDDDLVRRAATIAAFLLAGLGAVSTLLFVAAFQFRSDWFADPALVVAVARHDRHHPSSESLDTATPLEYT